MAKLSSTASLPTISPEDYLIRDRANAYKSEYCLGHKYAMAGASDRHNVINSNINGALFALNSDGIQPSAELLPATVPGRSGRLSFSKLKLMAPTATSLTVSQYDALYGSESGWEYWFGEPRRKPVPTKFHGILQSLLAELLRLAGYISAVEAELRNVPDWHPRPDVYGVLEEFEGAYPSRPVDVVFEVLSPQENIEAKCRLYSDSLIPAIFVFDPAEQTIGSWDGRKLLPVVDVKLANGVTITGATIWLEFTKRQKQTPPASMTI